MADLVFQNCVPFEADSVEIPGSLKGLVKLWDRKRGICPKKARDVALRVARNDRSQKRFPAIRAMDVTIAQGAAFQMAKLIEDEQRVIAVASEMPIPCGTFLTAMGLD